MLFLLTDSLKKPKSEKIHDALIMLFYVRRFLNYKDFSFSIKKKKTSTAAVDPGI